MRTASGSVSHFSLERTNQHPRKRAGAARMLSINAAIACNHDPGLLIERLDVRFDHRLSNDVGLGVSGVPFADQTDEHFHGEIAAVRASSSSVWLS